MPRKRRILELGSGIIPRKIMDLARNHPHTSFVAVEKEKTISIPQLRNLVFHSNTSALSFLRGEKKHFSHAFVHFTLGNMARVERIRTFEQLFRLLQPGARFVAVEVDDYHHEFKRELERIGFRVTIQRLTPEEIRKMDTIYSEQHYLSTVSAYPMNNLPKAVREKKFAAHRDRRRNQMQLAQAGKISRRTRAAIERTLKTIPDYIPERPFIRIIAKRPRKAT